MFITKIFFQDFVYQRDFVSQFRFIFDDFDCYYFFQIFCQVIQLALFFYVYQILLRFTITDWNSCSYDSCDISEVYLKPYVLYYFFYPVVFLPIYLTKRVFDFCDYTYLDHSYLKLSFVIVPSYYKQVICNLTPSSKC